MDFARMLDIWLPNGGSAFVMEAYFDESGTHGGSPVMCVGGYLFDKDQCKRFQNDFDELLTKHGIGYFHMAECAPGTNGFKQLSGSDRDSICRKIIGNIKLRAEIGVVVSVSQDDFRRAMPGVTWDPYQFCVTQCVEAVSAWVNKYNYRGEISYVFEAGHPEQESANSLIHQFSTDPTLRDGMRYASHAFVKGKRLCGIAAADLLVWEWAKDYKGRYQSPRRSQRLSLKSLLEKRHLARHWTLASLARYYAVCIDMTEGNIKTIPEEFRHYPDDVRGFGTGKKPAPIAGRFS